MGRFFHYDAVTGCVREGHKPVENTTSRVWKPIECCASGVHASQAGELREFFRKHGESVEVTADGNPVYESASQRKRLLKLRGLHDRNSYS